MSSLDIDFITVGKAQPPNRKETKEDTEKRI